MLAKKFQQVLAPYKHYLAGFQGFGGNFIRASRHRRTEAEDLTGPGNAKHQALAALGAYRQLGASVAKDKDSSRLPPFGEQNRPPGVRSNCLDTIKRLERVCG
jgi:hypothetical protein